MGTGGFCMLKTVVYPAKNFVGKGQNFSTIVFSAHGTLPRDPCFNATSISRCVIETFRNVGKTNPWTKMSVNTGFSKYFRGSNCSFNPFLATLGFAVTKICFINCNKNYLQQWFSHWGPQSPWGPQSSFRGTTKRSQIFVKSFH